MMASARASLGLASKAAGWRKAWDGVAEYLRVWLLQTGLQDPQVWANLVPEGPWASAEANLEAVVEALGWTPGTRPGSREEQLSQMRELQRAAVAPVKAHVGRLVSLTDLQVNVDREVDKRHHKDIGGTDILNKLEVGALARLPSEWKGQALRGKAAAHNTSERQDAEEQDRRK